MLNITETMQLRQMIKKLKNKYINHFTWNTKILAWNNSDTKKAKLLLVSVNLDTRLVYQLIVLNTTKYFKRGRYFEYSSQEKLIDFLTNTFNHIHQVKIYDIKN